MRKAMRVTLSRRYGLAAHDRVGTPPSSPELLEHLEDRPHDLLGRLDLDLVRPQPGLVPPQRMLPGRGQVAVGAIGQLDGEGRLQRAPPLDLEAGLGEDLERD